MPKRPRQTKARMRTLAARLHRERVGRLYTSGKLDLKQHVALQGMRLKRSMTTLMTMIKRGLIK